MTKRQLCDGYAVRPITSWDICMSLYVRWCCNSVRCGRPAFHNTRVSGISRIEITACVVGGRFIMGNTDIRRPYRQPQPAPQQNQFHVNHPPPRVTTFPGSDWPQNLIHGGSRVPHQTVKVPGRYDRSKCHFDLGYISGPGCPYPRSPAAAADWPRAVHHPGVRS